jgi:FMN-dependent NADH-azoreductase
LAQVLYLTANPKSTPKSTSLSLGAEFLMAYKEANPEDEIVVIDLYNYDIPELEVLTHSRIRWIPFQGSQKSC